MKTIALLPLMLVSLWVSGCMTTASSSSDTLPDGFDYYTAENGVGTYLVPNGWYVKEETQKGTDALFITREDIDTQGHFEVGFTVNRVPDFSEHTATAATTYAKNFAEQLVVEHDALYSDTITQEGETLNVVRVRLNDEPSTIVHYITLGRADRDEFYLIFFEAPQDEWEQAFKTGKILLDGISLPP